LLVVAWALLALPWTLSSTFDEYLAAVSGYQEALESFWSQTKLQVAVSAGWVDAEQRVQIRFQNT
jgi:hypothetical protein